MSNAARCHDCNHRRGPRSTDPIAAADKGRQNKRGVMMPAHDEQPKKAPCGCACHDKAA